MVKLWVMVAALWVALHWFVQNPTPPGERIISLHSNFTIVTHWLEYANTSKWPVVCCLVRLLMALLVYFPLQGKLQDCEGTK